ncbi:MAG: peptidoglycan-binding domain-containing protein [Pseudomonadota bacterium]
MADLSNGDKGSGVRSLQQKLNKAGASPELAQDGQFGAATETAVKAFQSQAGLPQTGVYTSIVAKTLDAFSAVKASPMRFPVTVAERTIEQIRKKAESEHDACLAKLDKLRTRPAPDFLAIADEYEARLGQLDGDLAEYERIATSLVKLAVEHQSVRNDKEAAPKVVARAMPLVGPYLVALDKASGLRSALQPIERKYQDLDKFGQRARWPHPDIGNLQRRDSQSMKLLVRELELLSGIGATREDEFYVEKQKVVKDLGGRVTDFATRMTASLAALAAAYEAFKVAKREDPNATEVISAEAGDLMSVHRDLCEEMKSLMQEAAELRQAFHEKYVEDKPPPPDDDDDDWGDDDDDDDDWGSSDDDDDDDDDDWGSSDDDDDTDDDDDDTDDDDDDSGDDDDDWGSSDDDDEDDDNDDEDTDDTDDDAVTDGDDDDDWGSGDDDVLDDDDDLKKD